MENDRTDVPHLFGFVKIIRNQEHQVLNKIYGWHLVKFGQDRKLVKKNNIWRVLRMGLRIVENLSGLQESIFSLSRGPQLHLGEKSKYWSNFIQFTDFPLSPCLGSLGLLS